MSSPSPLADSLDSQKTQRGDVGLGAAEASRSANDNDPVAERFDFERAEAERPDLEEEASRDEVALNPSETGDPVDVVERAIPEDIRERYEVHSYRNAAVVLSQAKREEFEDLLTALRAFRITTTMIRTAGGNESEIPKQLSTTLRGRGWYETIVRGDLHVKLIWKEPAGSDANGKPQLATKTREIRREKFLDGHKIDYVKGKVAFDLEWNSKDQTFDRDLYAFSAFAQCGVIDVAVLLTRGASMEPALKTLGEALRKDGSVETNRSGRPRLVREKYGASTTWMGKLLYRLNAGRNGGCPVLAIGITPKCIEDWSE
jgi:hypothetical protein